MHSQLPGLAASAGKREDSAAPPESVHEVEEPVLLDVSGMMCGVLSPDRLHLLSPDSKVSPLFHTQLRRMPHSPCILHTSMQEAARPACGAF